MKGRYGCIFLLAILLVLGGNAAFSQTAQLTVKIVVPANLPKTDSLVIIGNQPAFGDWFDFTKGKMSRQDDTTWVFQSPFSANTSIEFQITRGTYNRGAVFTNGKFAGPKPFNIKKDTTV